MSEICDEHYKNTDICRFCEKKISDKVRDYCHLFGKYKGPAHQSCNINVKQQQSSFMPFLFHSFSIYGCFLVFYKVSW